MVITMCMYIIDWGIHAWISYYYVGLAYGMNMHKMYVLKMLTSRLLEFGEQGYKDIARRHSYQIPAGQ